VRVVCGNVRADQVWKRLHHGEIGCLRSELRDRT
jgi:hypothetical protein